MTPIRTLASAMLAAFGAVGGHSARRVPRACSAGQLFELFVIRTADTEGLYEQAVG